MTLATIAAAACLAVGSGDDQILLRHVAPAFATLGAAAPETPIGLAPVPGVERRFELPELQRLAARFGLPEPLREVCVTRPAAPLEPQQILAALHSAIPEARIELLEYSRYPVPEGDLAFPREGFHVSPSGAIWRGAVRYGGRHRAPVWARVRVTVAATRVVGDRDLPAGRPIDASALRLETRDEIPSPEPFPSTVEAVAGCVPRRTIRAGEAIRASIIDEPKAVTRGQAVEVEVRAGAARLRLTAQALASGAVGQTILVVNPESKKRFQARVEAAGRVAVGASL